MRLTSTGTSFLGDAEHATYREPIDPRRALAVLVARGFRPEIAREAAYGELSSEAARRLGCVAGLIELEEPR